MALNQEQFERLEAYIDGELTPAERADVEKQLVANPQLRKLMAELVATRDLLRGLPRSKAPADLVETFQGQIERAELLGESGPSESEVVVRIKRGPQYLAAAAIVLLALGMAGIIYKLMLPHGTPNSPFVAMRSPLEEPTATEPATRPTVTEAAKSEAEALSSARPIGESRATSGAAATRSSDALVQELERSRVSPEDLRRARSDLDAASAPAGEPIVMLVRSENPSQASEQVREYLDANKIPFDTAPGAGAGEAVTAKREGQFTLAARGGGGEAPAAPAPAMAATPEARSGGVVQAQRATSEPGGQSAEVNNRGAAEEVRDAALNDRSVQRGRDEDGSPQVLRQQQASGGQQMAKQQQRRPYVRGIGTPPQEPPPASQQQSQTAPAPAPVPQQAVNPAALASLANNNNGVTGGKVYRVVLTQRQLRDLNTRLQSQGNQWTEFRGLTATDAIENNGLAGAVANAVPQKAMNESLTNPSKSFKVETASNAAIKPPTLEATTLPVIVAPPGPAFADHAADAKGFSLRSATTLPTTNPSAGIDRESLREVLIVVNDQPIDTGGGVAAIAPATQPAAGAAAQTQPAAAPTRPAAPALTTPDPRP